MIDLKTRKHFGIQQLGEFSSDTTDMFAGLVKSAILQNMMCAVIAPYGSGKTHLVRNVKSQLANSREHSVQFAHVGDLSEKVRMTSILSALVRRLSLEGEGPRRSIEARSEQIRRLLGMAHVGEGKRVCLVIEDAHRLTPETLSRLKLLREKSFQGEAPLLSIVMLAWPQLDETLEHRRDILTRTQRLHLLPDEGWMDLGERTAYLQQRFGELIEEETRALIAQLNDVPAEMNHAVAEGLRDARLAGYDVLDERSYQPSLRKRYERLHAEQGVSLSDIGKAAGGLSPSSVSDTVNGKSSTNREVVREGLRALERRQNGNGLRSVS